jgi:arylsulfatase A-like enzyme
MIGHLSMPYKENITLTSQYFSFLSRTGPLSALSTDFMTSFFFNRTHDEFSNFKIVKKPIISMKEYLKGFDHEQMKKYNVILIIIESLRPDQLTSFSGSRSVMPEIDNLARDAYIFPNTYAQSSQSSYADMCPLSSHYPLRSLIFHHYPTDIKYPRVLIYDVLKNLGYKTAIISSQNEHWGSMYNYLNTPNLDIFLHAENYKGNTYVPYNDTGFVNWLKGKKQSGKIDDRYTVTEAIKWIDSLKGDPFFIYLNLQNSHIPFQVPSDFPRKFGPNTINFSSFNNFPI